MINHGEKSQIEISNRDTFENNKSTPFADDIITFSDINCDNIESLVVAGQKCPYFLSCYAPGCLVMWKDYLNPSYALFSGCVIIKTQIDKKESFLFPYPYEENADIDTALFAIEKYVAKNSIKYSFLAVPRSVLPHIVGRYKNFSVVTNRNQSDYIYLSEDMQTFAGKKYSGQRNHINKFTKMFPKAVFRELSDSDTDKQMLEVFWERFGTVLKDKPKSALIEFKNAKKMFSRPCVRTAHKACIEVDDEIISICFGEVFSDMLIIHIEKALDEYPGVYPFMVTSFAKAYGSNVKYINRQDDAGSRGLRISKTQYNPLKIEENISVKLKTELSNLHEMPSIKSERLTISPIEEQDIDAYNKLCLDDEHNKYWGYDYRTHISGEVPYDYFHRAVLNDFKNRVGMSLAIKYNGEFIGEAVLNEFDFRGSANVGLRLLPEFTGQGYAKEAFCMLCDFALYNMGLNSLTAYCYKENIASYKMISSCMKLSGEDGKYYYFIKMV